MPNITVELNLNQIVRSFSGEAVKNLIDAPTGTKAEDAKDMTLGDVLGNSMFFGVKSVDKKQQFKAYQMGLEIQKAIADGGRWQVDDKTLSELEELWSKVDHPTFSMPIHSGFVQDCIKKTKLNLLKETEKPQQS